MPHAAEGAMPVVAGSVNCLIVDDEPSVRRSLSRMLQAQGFQCLEACSGREGLRVLEQTGEIPLIISDMKMPELDGMGFLEAVRQKFPDSSVIMLSGMSETTTAVDCLHLGAADFLLKPISLSELQARVARALEKRSLVLQNRFYHEHLEQQVQAQAQRIQELFLQGVQMLARALEAKDAYTRGHSIRVSQYAVATAARLGFAGPGLDGIRLGGELHDIGKIGTCAGGADALSPGPRVARRPANRALTPRAPRWRGLSRRATRREDPYRGAYRRRGRFVRCHDDPETVS
jgi:putative two-component system response regulator